MTGGKHFINDYRPVSVYMNNIKLAGWINQNESDESPIGFVNTYNDYITALTLSGKSVQDGTPAPTTPIDVLSVEDAQLLISDDYVYRQSFNIPTLRKIGDVADTYNPVTGEYVRRIGEKEFDGTETGWLLQGENANGIIGFYYTIAIASDTPTLTSVPALSTHLKYTGGSLSTATSEGFFIQRSSATLVFYFRLLKSQFTDLNAFKAWLSSNNITVYYQLATPITTWLTPITVQSFYPMTNISTLTDNGVMPDITATAKIMEV